MFTSIIKTGCVRRALMAGAFVAVGALTIGTTAAPAQAQYYSSQYGNPYYSGNPYEGYRARQAWWRWHQYWRWYHWNYQNER